MSDDDNTPETEPEIAEAPEPAEDAQPVEPQEGDANQVAELSSENELAEDAPESKEGDANEPKDPDELDPDKEITFLTKVNGKEVEQKATLSDLIDAYQKDKASDEKFREAASKEKGVKKAIEVLLGDPVKGYVQLCMVQHNCDAVTAEQKVDEYLIDYYAKKLTAEAEEAKLSPEARELKHTRAELDAIRKEKADQESLKQRQQAEVHAEEYLRKVDSDVMAALKAADLKAEPAILKQVLQKISKSFSLGREITADVALKAVLRDRKQQLEELFKTLPIADLIERYPEHAESLRKIDSDRLQKNRARLKGETKPGLPATSTSKPKSKPRFTSPSDAYAEVLRQ